MADISKEIDQIKNAIYGEEVRQSLIDGMTAINNSVDEIDRGMTEAETKLNTVVKKSPNILPLYTDDVTSLGLTISFKDNMITISGQSTDQGNIPLYDYIAFLESYTDYTFSVHYLGGETNAKDTVGFLGIYTRNSATLLGSTLGLATIAEKGSSQVTFNGNVQETQYVRLSLAGKGITFNNLKLALQLEEGTEATAYASRGYIVNPDGIVYSKDDIDNLMANITDDFYSKDDIDNLMANITDDFYSKDDIDDLMANITDDFYSKDEVKSYAETVKTELGEISVLLDYELTEKGKTFRIAVATDLHCGSDCGGYYNGVWQNTSEFVGMTYKERMQLFVDSINKENREKPFDMLLITGDISVNGADKGDVMVYLKEFVNDYASQLDMPVFYIGGNHDPYSNGDWKSVIGYNREFSIETEDYYFICLDSFKTTESGTEVSYNGFDDESLAFFKTEIAKAGKKGIFVCSHYFKENLEDEFWKIFYTTENIIGRIEGHAHVWFNAWTKAEIDGVTYQKYRANSGGFCYPSTEWGYAKTSPSSLWGFRVIEYDADNSRLYTWQVQLAHNYVGISNDYPYTIGTKSTMKSKITKNPRANFYIPSSYRSMDRITRALALSNMSKEISDIKTKIGL